MDLKHVGLETVGKVGRNLSSEELTQRAVKLGEGVLGMNNALMVDTGKYTGRSPRDRFIVDEPSCQDNIWWGDVNRPISEEVFNRLYQKVLDYYNTNEDSRGVLIFDGYSGDDARTSMPVRFISKKAWQAIFVNNMFIRPTNEQLKDFSPRFTTIIASEVIDKSWEINGLNSETFIIFHFGKGVAIIGGTEYGGEMKKGIFSVMNYHLPLQGILTMHCAANVDKQGENSALFFGLSGTGKTTLSTDPNRLLIGDDEHAWSDKGIFNLEGGCYAKAINLTKEAEPEIWNAIRHGSILENVVYDEQNGEVDFSDRRKTENTRICYPIDYIEDSLAAAGKPSAAGHPKNIVFLSCDAYGVLPSVARLNLDQTMYHFISGYTAKVAGTERGVNEPKATFSSCFGEPFLTLRPSTYAKLLRKKIKQNNTHIYLVNTGWSGGAASTGASRIPLNDTRRIISAILSGELEKADYRKENVFGLDVPTAIDGISSPLLPIEAWEVSVDYYAAAKNLVAKFRANFQKYLDRSDSFYQGGPIL